MLIGYARVSTHDQNLTLQTDALKKAGCQKIFEDRVSGAKSDRAGLKATLEYVRKGDTLLVWRLDRLGRSLKELIEIISGLEKRGVGFRSLQESYVLIVYRSPVAGNGSPLRSGPIVEIILKR